MRKECQFREEEKISKDMWSNSLYGCESCTVGTPEKQKNKVLKCGFTEDW